MGFMNQRAFGLNQVADFIRLKFPMTAAFLDAERVPYSMKYLQFARNLDSQRVARGIPAVGM